VLGLAACSSGGTAPEGDEPTSLTIALTADPRSLLGASSTVQQEINVSEQITEKLIEFSVDATQFEPRLATAWEQVDDTTLRLTLREGVTFTNGEPFDAESVVYSLDEVMLAAPAYSAFVSMIESAEAVDEHTVDVTSASPTGLMPLALAMGSFQYPKDYLAEVGEEEFGSAPVGTGPYVLDEWVRGERVSLTANPDYWDGAPAVDEVTFQVIPDKSAQMAAIQSGQIDLMNDIPVGSVETARNSSGLSFVTRPSNRVFYLILSTLTDTPLQDPAVRRALWYAIDTQSLIDQQLGGLGSQLTGQVLVESYFGFDPDVATVEYDPDRARELLAEAGYPDGFEVVFTYSSGRYAQDAELGQAIAAQLAEVGVTVEQEVLESGTFLTQLTSLELNDMALMGSLPPPDAHFMYQQFQSGSTYSYSSIPAIDALIEQEMATADADERRAIFREMSDIFQEDPAFVPLFQGEDTYLMDAGLSGFEPRASQFLDLRALATE